MSNIRLRRRPISETVEKVPDHFLKVDREVSKKIVEKSKKLRTDLTQNGNKVMFKLNKTWRN